MHIVQGGMICKHDSVTRKQTYRLWALRDGCNHPQWMQQCTQIIPFGT